MRVNNIEELSSYLAFFRLHPHEVMALRQDLLAPITNFFREMARAHTLFNASRCL
jgi:chemotaxis methyl-accepting protein methylase